MVRQVGERLEWRACVGDVAVGTATVHGGSGAGACFIRLSVEPGYRRRGVGRELLEAVRSVLRSVGCVTVEAIAAAGSDGEAFARRLGATVGDELAEDVLPFATLDRPRLQALRVPRPGYVVRRWIGAAPDDLLEAYAVAKHRISDAPNNYPPAVPDWSPALVREQERARAARGAALWVAAAVPAGTDLVVAFTEVEVVRSGTAASQVDTVVLPEHRRIGLATIVKADLLLELHDARPDLRSVGATCAVANKAMRSVNHRLGFREEQRRTLYRLAL